jgi:hypothetical protein
MFWQGCLPCARKEPTRSNLSLRPAGNQGHRLELLTRILAPAQVRFFAFYLKINHIPAINATWVGPRNSAAAAQRLPETGNPAKGTEPTANFAICANASPQAHHRPQRSEINAHPPCGACTPACRVGTPADAWSASSLGNDQRSTINDQRPPATRNAQRSPVGDDQRPTTNVPSQRSTVFGPSPVFNPQRSTRNAQRSTHSGLRSATINDQRSTINLFSQRSTESKQGLGENPFTGIF